MIRRRVLVRYVLLLLIFIPFERLFHSTSTCQACMRDMKRSDPELHSVCKRIIQRGMEKWESYYHHWGTYPATYSRASRVTYPLPRDGQYNTPYRGSVFTSASVEWSAGLELSNIQSASRPRGRDNHFDKLPISIEDDPEPQV